MKPKNKILRTVLTVALLLLVSMALGVVCGLMFLKTGLFDLQRGLHGIPALLSELWFLAAFALTYYLEIALHEGGHLLCGLWSGYTFVSYRLGSMLWMREGGKLVRKRFSLAGTGGQCLMAPPGDSPDAPFPQMLYNFGGVLANLVTGLLFFALLAIPGVHTSLFWMPIAVFGGLGALYMALSNGIPLAIGPVPNDGWNALHLAKDPEARRAFWVTLSVNARQYEGVRLRDMPEAWFALPSEEAMKNGMTATLAVLAENRAMDALDFARAEALFPVIRSEQCRAAELYKKLLVCDEVTCALLRDGAADVSALRERSTARLLRQMKDFPSVLRAQYAAALLHDGDESQAQKLLARFDKVAETYPAQADIKSEREIIDRIRSSYAERRPA